MNLQTEAIESLDGTLLQKMQRYRLWIFLAISATYLVSYFHRAAPAVVGPEITKEFGVFSGQAGSGGVVSAVFLVWSGGRLVCDLFCLCERDLRCAFCRNSRRGFKHLSVFRRGFLPIYHGSGNQFISGTFAGGLFSGCIQNGLCRSVLRTAFRHFGICFFPGRSARITRGNLVV